MDQFKQRIPSIPPLLQEIGGLALLALAYLAAIQAGLFLVERHEGVATIWPASGLALAVLLRNPKAQWTKITAVIFSMNLLSNIVNGNPLLVSLGFALVNIIEAILCAAALLKLSKTPITFENTRDVFALLGVAVFINGATALLTATIPTLIFGTSFFNAWRIWWIADGLGMLLFTPLLITWRFTPLLNWTGRKVIEAILLLVSLSLFSWLLFGPFTISEQPILRSYMLFPFLIWLAFRYNQRCMTTALLLVTGISFWGTLQHYGIFSYQLEGPKEELIALQLYLSAMAFSGLLLSAMITERKRNAETLQIAEANYRNILENAPIGFFQSYLEGGYRSINPRMAQIFGFASPEEMLNSVTDITHQVYATPAPRQEFRRQVFQNGPVVDFVTQHRRKDGRPFWTSTNARVILNEQGQPDYFEGFLQDIDERIKAEENIQKSREFVQATMDSLSAHICVLEADGTILAVNKAWMEFANENSPIISSVSVGVNYLNICDKTTGPEAQMARAFAAGIHAVLAGQQETFNQEYPCHAPHEQRWFMGRVMRFADKTTNRVVIAHENITERKLAEDALHKSQQFAISIADNIPGMLGYWTNDLRCSFANKGYTTWFGRTPDQMQGITIRELLGEELFKKNEIHAHAALRGEVQQFERTIIKPNGEPGHTWAQYIPHYVDGEIQGFFAIVTDITQLKQDQERLRISEEKWRGLFAILPVGISILDAGHKIIDFNHALENILDITGEGLREGTYNNRTYLRANGSPMPPEEFPSQRAMQQQIVINSAQMGIVKEDHEIIWVEMSAAPLGLPDAACVIVTTDVTRRKQIERALRDVNERLSMAQRAANAGLWDWEMSQDFYNWSPELFQLFGLDPAITPNNEIWLNSLHKEDRQRSAEYLQKAIREHLPINNEYRIILPSGEVRWINALGNTTYDKQGQPQHMAGICVDITARKQIENALLESEAQLKGIVVSTMDGIVMVDNNQRIILFNEAAEKMFGYPAERVIGQSLDFIIPQDKQTIHQRHIEKFAASGVTNQNMMALMEISARRINGERFPVETSISQFVANGQKFYTAILRDVTERKQMEDNLRSSLLEKEALLKEVHHRVKNNLQIISSLLSMQANSAKNEKVTQALEESKNRVRAMALIHEKLYRSENLEYIQAEEYIPELTNYLSGSLIGYERRHIQFDLQIAHITFDIGKAIPCGMIITELVSNALKYAFEPDKPGMIKVHLDVENEEGRIRLMVSDNGFGLPPEIDYRRPATLGLELVSILSRQLKAELQVIREPGTTFILTFRN